MLGGIRNDQLMDQTWHYVDKTYGMYNTGAVPASFHYGRNAEKGGKERQQILELYIQQQVLHAVFIETVERGQFGKHEEPVFEYFLTLMYSMADTARKHRNIRTVHREFAITAGCSGEPSAA